MAFGTKHWLGGKKGISATSQIAKTFHGAYEGQPDPHHITRTPESAFEGVPQPFAPRYFQVHDPVYNVSTKEYFYRADGVDGPQEMERN